MRAAAAAATANDTYGNHLLLLLLQAGLVDEPGGVGRAVELQLTCTVITCSAAAAAGWPG
jgi:hypothetical protein